MLNLGYVFRTIFRNIFKYKFGTAYGLRKELNLRKFETTRHELGKCMTQVRSTLNSDSHADVSDLEVYHFNRMIHECIDFLRETKIMDHFGIIDEVRLNEICNRLHK